MSLDMFLKLDKIEGDSLDSAHSKQIEITEYGFGMHQQVDLSTKGGGGSKASFNGISINKYLDKSTPLMMQALAKGTLIATAQITIRKAGGDKPLDYYKISLTGVFLEGYRTMPQTADSRPMENWSLAFKSFKVVYQPQDDSGGKDGGEVDFGWDIVAGKEL